MKPSAEPVSPSNPAATATSETSLKSASIDKTPLEILQQEIEQIQSEIERNDDESRQLQNDHQQVHESVEQYLRSIAKLRDEKRLKERTHILLEDPEVNVKKLEGIIAAGGDQMRKLQDQWDAHRTPLIEMLEAQIIRHSELAIELTGDVVDFLLQCSGIL